MDPQQHSAHQPTVTQTTGISGPNTLNQNPWERWRWDWQSRNNALHWALRNFMHWSPGHYRETPAGHQALKGLPPEAIDLGNTLLDCYGLKHLPQRASEQRVLETLTYLHWLDQIFQQHPHFFQGLTSCQPDAGQPFRWLDVGAKNWAYVEALDGFIRQQLSKNADKAKLLAPVAETSAPTYELDGVELDPHRRYTNLQTRAQAAQAFIQHLPHAAYHAGAIQQWQQPADIISLFLPFVFEEPHLAWGLPLNHFAPQALLNHLLDLLAPGGLLIVVNQGEVEAKAQASLWSQVQAAHPNLRLQIESLGQLDAPFIEYRYPRMGWLCQKQPVH